MPLYIPFKIQNFLAVIVQPYSVGAGHSWRSSGAKTVGHCFKNLPKRVAWLSWNQVPLEVSNEPYITIATRSYTIEGNNRLETDTPGVMRSITSAPASKVLEQFIPIVLSGTWMALNFKKRCRDTDPTPRGERANSSGRDLLLDAPVCLASLYHQG